MTDSTLKIKYDTELLYDEVVWTDDGVLFKLAGEVIETVGKRELMDLWMKNWPPIKYRKIEKKK